MALVKKTMGKKEITRLVVIVVVIALIGVIVLSIISERPDVNLNIGSQLKDEPIIRDTGRDLLDNAVFSQLKLHGDLPVEEGSVGKLNPFTPFN